MRLPRLTLIEKIIIVWFGLCGVIVAIDLVALTLYFLRG